MLYIVLKKLRLVISGVVRELDTQTFEFLGGVVRGSIQRMVHHTIQESGYARDSDQVAERKPATNN